MTSLIGQIIGEKYEILSELGRGGMGAVYQARDLTLGRIVAIKALKLDRDASPKDRERFRREARSLAMLEHPNVLPIYELLEEADTTYMVMQYIKGGSLKEIIHDVWSGDEPGGISPELVVTVIVQVARALDYAHNKGIIHRDIKPGNVLLSEDDRVLLADFGIAKWTDVTQDTSLTADGAAVGTPAFMSPEQINGHELGPPSDVYSLAIVAYQLLTGHVPFEGDTISVIYKQINEPPPPPTELNDTIPVEVEYVLLKALDKDPEERFERAGNFAAALQASFALVTGEVDLDKGSIGERIRESTVWGRVARGRRTQRQPVEREERGLLQRLLVGVARTVATIFVVLLITTTLLVVGVGLLMTLAAENIAARTVWCLDGGPCAINYSEEELSELLTDNVAISLPGIFDEMAVTFEPSGEITVIGNPESDHPAALTGTLRVNDEGQPIVSILRYNDFPLSVFGAAISGGINRGMIRPLADENLFIAEMDISDDRLFMDLRLLSEPGVTGATPTPEPTLTPSPTAIPGAALPPLERFGTGDQVNDAIATRQHFHPFGQPGYHGKVVF